MKSRRPNRNTKAAEELANKFTANVEVIKSEFFATEVVTYRAVGADLVENSKAVFAFLTDIEDSEATIRNVIDNYRDYAEWTVQAADDPSRRKARVYSDSKKEEEYWQGLRHIAIYVLVWSKSLLVALDESSLFKIAGAAMRLEKWKTRLQLAVKNAELNAQSGREMKDSNRKAADNRWAATAAERQQRNEKWREEASRLRTAHPDWKERAIANDIHSKHNPDNISLRHIQSII